MDYSVRDYRKYFKPLLCYLEGAWIYPTDQIEEPFESDRHFIDATSWFDLQEKVRFTSYSGRKDNLENYSYLPRAILGLKMIPLQFLGNGIIESCVTHSAVIFHSVDFV